MPILKVNNVEDDNISKIDGIASDSISKYGGQTFEAAAVAAKWLFVGSAGKVWQSNTSNVASGSVSELVDLGGQTFYGVTVGEDGSSNKRWVLHQDVTAGEIWYANDSGSLGTAGSWVNVDVTNGKQALGYGGPNLAWGNGKWVGVGTKRTHAGKYYTAMSSSDGATWEEISSNVWTSNANGFIVGYKETNFWATPVYPNMYTSSDGVTWGQTPITTTLRVNSLAYDGTSRWVAVGNSGGSWYSDDNFATITTGSYPHGNNCWGLVYAKGSINKWIAVGGEGEMAYSTDGVTFSASTLPGIVGTKRFYQIATDNTTICAVGQSGMILTSSDGLNWAWVSSSDVGTANIHAVSSDVIGAGWR